ncbi:unnamed protein product [Camellia sinensis]
MNMRTTRLVFKFRAKAATTSLCITAAGAGALATHTINPSFPPFSDHSRLISAAFSQKIRAGLGGVVRSSRAIWTITANVVDYKYSLHGLSVKSDEYQHVLSEVHLRSAKRILRLCEANKGFYVKAGQFVAALQQVPKEYSSTLISLQDQVVPCNFKAIKDVLTSNLGPDLSEIFLFLDEHPIAAASISQVHRAILKDHQEAAVKEREKREVKTFGEGRKVDFLLQVQYPGLELQLKVDIATMSFLSKSVAWQFGWLVSEFAETIALELDFIHEARNSERTAENFKNNAVVRVPFVFWELTTSQVLTMQFCKGCK